MSGGMFAWPVAAWGLLVPPLVWILSLARERRRARKLEATTGPRVRVLADVDARRRATRHAMTAGALVLAVLAAAQPLIGEGSGLAERRGGDVVVCLDVSRSMFATDVPPSRLAVARREIRELAARAQGDRLALVTFAGSARLTSPLTRDLETFADLVDAADPVDIARGGTDLGAALDSALAALEGGTGDHGAIILVTDGEDLGGGGLRAAEACKARRVPVHCVGLGSVTGSKILVEGEKGGAFLRDASGAEVVSALDPEALRKIADATGGEFVESGSEPGSLADLYARRVAPVARSALERQSTRERKNRFQWPLIAAFGLWAVALALSDRRRS
jgi:Ca-activated chloride channel homolog